MIDAISYSNSRRPSKMLTSKARRVDNRNDAKSMSIYGCYLQHKLVSSRSEEDLLCQPHYIRQVKSVDSTFTKRPIRKSSSDDRDYRRRPLIKKQVSFDPKIDRWSNGSAAADSIPQYSPRSKSKQVVSLKVAE